MKADQFTKSILDLDNDILFSGVIEKSGHLNISNQRESLDKHLKGRNAELIISESAYAVDLRKDIQYFIWKFKLYLLSI